MTVPARKPGNNASLHVSLLSHISLQGVGILDPIIALMPTIGAKDLAGLARRVVLLDRGDFVGCTKLTG